MGSLGSEMPVASFLVYLVMRRCQYGPVLILGNITLTKEILN